MANSVKTIVRFHDEEELKRCGYLRKDHSACARGYIHRGGSYIEEYHGSSAMDTWYTTKATTQHFQRKATNTMQ